MVFKSFITNRWNRLKNGFHQGLIGAKNVAHSVWNATKNGLIGAKNFAVNNPHAVGVALHALTPFASIFNKMPKGSVKEKLVKISEQFARGELKPFNDTQVSHPTGGSSSAQAAADLRKVPKNKSHKWIPFRGILYLINEFKRENKCL